MKENEKNDRLAKELKNENEQLRGQILILEGIQIDVQRVEDQDQNYKNKILEFEQKMNDITGENETIRIKNLELQQQLDFEIKKSEQMKQDHVSHIQQFTDSFNQEKQTAIQSELMITNQRHEKELNQCNDRFKFQEAKIQELEGVYEKLMREKTALQENVNK